MMSLPFKHIVWLLIVFSGCGHAQDTGDDAHEHTNALINETSPYLLQHAHNPVNWYPWGDEALKKAKDENKLLIISIGYSACHWCHVMEHESFEDSAVAALMNEHFVAIKVDREERPDIDQIYMNASYLISKSGGWPLNAIALPNGQPIFAGTYYPKKDWMKVLAEVQQYWEENPQDAYTYAQQVTSGIAQSEIIQVKNKDAIFEKDQLKNAYIALINKIDFEHGGRQGAPKFPMPDNQLFLLRYHHLQQDAKALEAVNVTLESMAKGGIYDHVGGGFARYSTDAYWKAPHFEKMLYDNGQLVSLYAEAYRLTKNPLYKQVVYETLAFVERELTTRSGAFYSSLDADSEGEEGKFYVWTAQELKEQLGTNAQVFMDYYSVQEHGNWEHGNNILYITKSKEKVAKKHGITLEELEQVIAEGKATLMKAREQRIRPGLDDKILTSWNALMLKGYVDAYRTFDDKEFLKRAETNARFIMDKMVIKGQLHRNHKEGKTTIPGFLDDYALAIDAFISLYQATFDEQWLKQAKMWTYYTLEHFHDEQSGMFYYTPDNHEPLITRKMELSDNVIASSNSVMAENLYLLGQYYYDKEFLSHAEQMVKNMVDEIETQSPYYSNWAMLLTYMIEEPYEVAIVGKDFEDKRIELDQHYLPNVLLLGGVDEGDLPLLQNKWVEGQTTIYVCRNKVCKLPTIEITNALEQIE